MNAYRVKKYIGAYTAAMNGLDALIFTAGIGENSDLIRRLICSDMEFFGTWVDGTDDVERASVGIEAASGLLVLLVGRFPSLENGDAWNADKGRRCLD